MIAASSLFVSKCLSHKPVNSPTSSQPRTSELAQVCFPRWHMANSCCAVPLLWRNSQSDDPFVHRIHQVSGLFKRCATEQVKSNRNGLQARDGVVKEF